MFIVMQNIVVVVVVAMPIILLRKQLREYRFIVTNLEYIYVYIVRVYHCLSRNGLLNLIYSAE